MKNVVFELGGEKRALHFDVGMLKLFGAMEKKEPLELAAGIEGYAQACNIVFCGVQRDHVLKKIPFDVTFEQVIEWVDALSMTELLNIVRAFNAAFKVEGEETTAGGEDKKK